MLRLMRYKNLMNRHIVGLMYGKANRRIAGSTVNVWKSYLVSFLTLKGYTWLYLRIQHVLVLLKNDNSSFSLSFRCLLHSHNHLPHLAFLKSQQVTSLKVLHLKQMVVILQQLVIFLKWFHHRHLQGNYLRHLALP